jgi:hypothetical protein
MSFRISLLAAFALTASTALAQAPARPVASGGVRLSAADQIASAVLPLPSEFRDAATVMGYGESGKLTTLRAGKGSFNCLAPDPAREQFHVACYHQSMEPFMARGRSLRAEGVKGDQVDTVRFREIAANKLAMPRTGGALYTLTSTTGAFDAASGKIAGARPLFVYYMPFATPATSGVSDRPSRSEPWLMYPGTAKAHVMLVGTMAP